MKVIYKFGTALGGLLEWYDFAIYAYFSTAIATAFFPNDISIYLRLVYTYGIFAITYLARPVGAFIFGKIADRYGRIVVLKITPILITTSSLAIAVLPNYSQFGIGASLLLLMARIVQGLCLGGDFCSSIVYLTESSEKLCFLHGSFGSCIGSCSILLSSLISACIYNRLGENAAEAYGWRIAFGLSLLFGIVIYLLRRKLPETAPYQQHAHKKVIKMHWQHIALATSIIAIHAATFYYFFIFLPSFLIKTTGMAAKAALINNSLFLLAHIAFIPIFGYLSDRFNGKKILLLNYVILLLIMYPLITHLNIVNQYFDFLIWIASILTAVNAGIIPTFTSSLFSTESRCVNFGVSFNLGFSIFGGLTPVLCLWFYKITSNNASIALYLMSLCFLSLVALLLTGKKHAY